MRDFYRDMFGLSVVEEDDGWADFSAGDCNIAIHAAGKHVTVGSDYEGPHKIVFHADDVAAARADLVLRGAAMGPVRYSATCIFATAATPTRTGFSCRTGRDCDP